MHGINEYKINPPTTFYIANTSNEKKSKKNLKSIKIHDRHPQIAPTWKKH